MRKLLYAVSMSGFLAALLPMGVMAQTSTASPEHHKSPADACFATCLKDNKCPKPATTRLERSVKKKSKCKSACIKKCYPADAPEAVED